MTKSEYDGLTTYNTYLMRYQYLGRNKEGQVGAIPHPRGQCSGLVYLYDLSKWVSYKSVDLIK